MLNQVEVLPTKEEILEAKPSLIAKPVVPEADSLLAEPQIEEIPDVG